MLSIPRVSTLMLLLGCAVVLTLSPPGSSAQTPSPVTSTPSVPRMTPPTQVPGTFIGPNQINPPGQPLCQSQNAHAGGQAVDALNLRIRLPASGTYNVNSGIADPGGEFVRVCYVEGDAAIFFGRDGRETVRRLSATSSPSAVNPIFDEITRNLILLSPPPPPRPLCLPQPSSAGGRKVPTVNGVTIDLPDGDYSLFITPPGSTAPTFTICYVQGNARLTLSAVTCGEVSREATTAAANAVLDTIARSCALPAPAAPATFTPVGGPIRPPDTGDAGMRAP